DAGTVALPWAASTSCVVAPRQRDHPVQTMIGAHHSSSVALPTVAAPSALPRDGVNPAAKHPRGQAFSHRLQFSLSEGPTSRKLQLTAGSQGGVWVGLSGRPAEWLPKGSRGESRRRTLVPSRAAPAAVPGRGV